MRKERVKKATELVGNALILLLGLAFLGNVFDLWSFNLFDGWWVLFLYIPAISGFIISGVTHGGVMLFLVAVVLTIRILIDVDGRIWGAALILYLAYLGGQSILKSWKTFNSTNSKTDGSV